jgi:bacillolysin
MGAYYQGAWGASSATDYRVEVRKHTLRLGRESSVSFLRSSRGLLVLGLLVVLMLCTTVLGASARENANGSGGFVALSGDEAHQYDVPGDVREVWRSSDEGVAQTRYQQSVGDAAVYGGQITVLSRGGKQVAVIGNHYPNLAPSNEVSVTKSQALDKVQRERGNSGKLIVTLFINPETGVRFYEVDSQQSDSRRVFHINAQTGAKIKEYGNLQETEETPSDPGIGVKGDTKQIDTTFNGAVHQMISDDDRQITYDAQNRNQLPGTLFADPDGTWNTAGRTSPGQPAGVDAHYYADVTDNYYQDIFSRNSLDDQGMHMVSTAHFSKDYNNAFWNGQQVTYGDGDGTVTFRELSGGLDVATHEFTHGVTEFTSGLIYRDESGALNEAFSDMLGNSSEFYAQTNGLDPAARPDWQIGEDVYLPQDVAPGFRNMADPAEDGDPDHYSERYTKNQDSGGVHINSGIPNHAYYLLVNGGRNAGEARGHAHTGPRVRGIGLAGAEQIFYTGFTSLPATANMSQARQATEAAAIALYGANSRQKTSTSDAWEAVGVR